MPPHCDALDGPVVYAARQALIAEDATLVLPYVGADDENEVREAFDRAVTVQHLGSVAAEVATRWFYETVVRLHRAGEHAPFTGLKPAGLDVGPVIPLAEKAIHSGDSADVYRLLTADLQHELADRLARVQALASSRQTSLAHARAYVQAMLGFQVYTNQVYQALHAEPHGEHEHAERA